MNQTTGALQWDHPSASQHPSTPQSSYYPSPQPQYTQQGFAPPPAAAQSPVPAKAGIMGKLSSLDPKAQTALAVGGGMVAGAFMEHEVEEFSDRPHFSHHHHAEQHFGLGSMAALLGSAGAGALGAKFFGRKGQTAQTVPQAYPVQAPPPPGYPGQSPPPGNPNSGPGFGSLGNFAAGGAAGMAGAFAAHEASNVLHHHHHQNQGGVPTTAGGSGGTGSFLGGLTYSGPRLTIHAAAYADADVTDRVRALVSPEQVLTIKSMNDDFGNPWPEVDRKSFTVLYQYGDRPLEVWAALTNSDGQMEIKHEALANVRMAYINKSPGRIISLIWGSENILRYVTISTEREFKRNYQN